MGEYCVEIWEEDEHGEGWCITFIGDIVEAIRARQLMKSLGHRANLVQWS